MAVEVSVVVRMKNTVQCNMTLYSLAEMYRFLRNLLPLPSRSKEKYRVTSVGNVGAHLADCRDSHPRRRLFFFEISVIGTSNIKYVKVNSVMKTFILSFVNDACRF